QHRVQEALPAETGLDRHEQQHVDLADDVQQRLDGRRGAQGDTGLGVLAAQVAGELHRGAGGLEVEGHRGGAGLGVGGGLVVRVLDHQVGVDRDGAALDDLLDHRGAEGQVRHEVVVHDVHVDAVGGGDPVQLGADGHEVGVEDAGVDVVAVGGVRGVHAVGVPSSV